ncbi:MAG: hypothetical protein ACUVRZ_03450 [Desulfobacca sp.]|uniref:hypothetical protein n=1 Tax=Desulfobacca sp. TaxID=2067990 RepID=UPI00404B4761
MAVLFFDPAKRRQARQSGSGQGPAKILSLEKLSDGVLCRVIQRAGEQEIKRLQYIYQLTHGEPEILPTSEQMVEIENGTIEF